MQVDYIETNDVERSTKNKPEKRQKIILESLNKRQDILLNECSNINNNLYYDHDMMQHLECIHDPQYLFFLSEAFNSFERDPFNKDHIICEQHTIKEKNQITYLNCRGLVPNVFPINSDRFKNEHIKKHLPVWKHISFYATDSITPIFKNTYQDVIKSAKTAYTSACHLINNKKLKYIYSLTTNPGHHAGFNFYGGYCFINNAMLAAFKLRDEFDKVCVLDIDYHAGDGTNNIISNIIDPGIKVFSIHMDPKYDYPHHRGFESENNNSMTNCTVNPNCESDEYHQKLDLILEKIKEINPDVLVVPLHRS
jgi:acetoin utilization deacetylase AcuC-like enzyme